MTNTDASTRAGAPSEVVKRVHIVPLFREFVLDNLSRNPKNCDK